MVQPQGADLLEQICPASEGSFCRSEGFVSVEDVAVGPNQGTVFPNMNRIDY